MAKFEIHLMIELIGLDGEFDVRGEEKEKLSLVPSGL